MRLANLNGRAVVVTDGGAVDVAKVSCGRFGPDVQSLYEEWAAFRSFAAVLDLSAAEAFDEHDLGSPAPAPRQVFAIGLNYQSHAEETGAALPSVPATFTKFPASLSGPFAEVELASDTVDWEVELVVVIGRLADRVAEPDGWAHVAGLTVGQDISERTTQYAAGFQFSLGKSYRGFGPMGPWLVTPDELDNPDDLGLGCSIDGVTVQDARTGELIFGVPRLIAELSAVVSLLPGDVIFTGTPAGVGKASQPPRYLQAGETLESWVEGIGTMRNRIVAATH
jgi:2-keto-4-pentenoate hydratase/2-oxohepta-3-ene-1,7-dioic acid hydratase in catechol pathway